MSCVFPVLVVVTCKTLGLGVGREGLLYTELKANLHIAVGANKSNWLVESFTSLISSYENRRLTA